MGAPPPRRPSPARPLDGAPRRAPRGAPALVFVALLAALAPALGAAADGFDVGALFHRGLAPVELGATPAEQRSAAACAGCHAAEHAEWAQSRHAVAWTNGIFQREFLREPLDWCVRCHAPLAPGDLHSVDAVSAEGVSCAVCHLRDGRMLAATKRPDSPHDTVAVAGFGSAAYCEGCHQFAFPVVEEDGSVHRYTEHPMQDTVAEFRAGAHKDRPGECLGCHGNTPAGHRLPGGHDLGALQHAAELSVCRPDRRSLRVTMRNVGAGHKLPTGDLHRAFRVRAWRSTNPVAFWEGFVGRAFVPAPDQGKVVTLETSLPPLASRSWDVPLADLGGTPEEPVNIELRYIYTADELPTARNDPGEPTYAVVHALRVAPTAAARCAPEAP